MKINKKIISIFLILILSTIFTSCSKRKGVKIVEDVTNGIVNDFFTRGLNDYEVNIYFLDLDNINNGNAESIRTFKSNGTTCVGSCDSYIIKIGNTEILVDAGYQTFVSDPYTKSTEPYTFTYEYLKQNVHQNLLRKIATICTDGILEYLVVTHSDFDHIASLCVEGGIIDAFSSHEKIINLDNKEIQLKKINNVIDFNSGVIALHSYYKIDNDRRLCRGLYQTYLQKLEKLKKAGTNCLPAAALFDYSIVAEDGTKMTEKNKLLATPEKLKKYVYDENYYNIVILSETKSNDAAAAYLDEVIKNKAYKHNVSKLGGSLKNENGRYYYEININGIAQFRILYNWYYDFTRRQNFNEGNRGQSINNPSVCIEIVKNDFKFLACGDLGGNGENGLINYYKETSILKNITLYKAAHHGSTNNGENSKALFNLITPQIIVVTGCAQSPLEIKNATAAYMKQEFFNNIYYGLHDQNGTLTNLLKKEPYILCTNIDWFRLNKSNNTPMNESKPFYGDIRISTKRNTARLSYSYTGNIHALVKTNSTDDTIDFTTYKKRKIVKIQDTIWFDKVGFKYGGNK